MELILYFLMGSTSLVPVNPVRYYPLILSSSSMIECINAGSSLIGMSSIWESMSYKIKLSSILNRKISQN